MLGGNSSYYRLYRGVCEKGYTVTNGSWLMLAFCASIESHKKPASLMQNLIIKAASPEEPFISEKPSSQAGLSDGEAVFDLGRFGVPRRLEKSISRPGLFLISCRVAIGGGGDILNMGGEDTTPVSGVIYFATDPKQDYLNRPRGKYEI